jgi:hypothetical protein
MVSSGLKRSSRRRAVVSVSFVLFLLFGGVLIPVGSLLPVGREEAQITLTGAEAEDYLQQRSSQDPSFHAGIAKSLSKAKSVSDSVANRLVTVRRQPQQKVTSILGWVAAKAAVLADPISLYDGDYVLVLTPFEADSDPDTIEFNSYSSDGATDFEAWADVRLTVHSYGASVVLSNEGMACGATAPARGIKILSLFSAALNAQLTHNNIDCNDTPALNAAWGPRHSEIVRETIEDLLPIALNCAVINSWNGQIAFLPCVGLSWSFDYFGKFFWEAARMIWNCRCLYMNIGCDDEGGAPPI